MALTRSFLKGMDIDAEKIQSIIDAHTETVEALKEERDNWKTKAEKLADTEQKLTDATTAAEKAKTDYEKQISDLNAQVQKLTKESGDVAKVQADFDAFKQKVADEKANGEKSAALDDIIKGAGITSEAARKLILKGYDLSTVTMKDGKIDNADALSESIKKDYADFIPTTKTKGTDPVTPPSNGGKNKMTKDEILAIRDGATRRQAIADNPQLFGLDQ